MEAELEERLARIEAHLAHVERQNEQLNAVLVDQSRTLARMQGLVRRLSESLEERELERIRDTPSKPPHSAL